MITVTFTDRHATHTVHTKGEAISLINHYFKEEASDENPLKCFELTCVFCQGSVDTLIVHAKSSDDAIKDAEKSPYIQHIIAWEEVEET